MRVDHLEYAMGGVVSKIDTVLTRMAAEEKTREDKREIMGDFFDPGRRDSDLREMVEEASSREGENEDEEEEE